MKRFLFLLLCVLSISSFAVAQTTVTGTVTDKDGDPLIGANVLVKGTSVGTITDFDGIYEIDVPEGSDVIRYSYTGFETKEISIDGQNTIDVSLTAGQLLDEVIVTALGIRKEKKALGYAAQAISSKEIALTGNSDLMGSLQGKIAGVDIKPSSGMPGASSQFVIRGARSFTGNNTPLYVVDGMPIASTAPYSTGNSVTGADIGNRALDINPADIASIDVLKGQAASALYGIKGSNGVILITTKSGKGLPVGKPVISISHNSGYDVVSRSPDYQTKYAQGSYGVYGPTTSFSWGPKISDLPDDPQRGGNTDNAFTQRDGMQQGKFYVPQLEQVGLDPWKTPQVYNSWEDYFQTGYTTSNNINVAQATENGNFSVGFNVTDQSGIALATGMTRYNAKANGEHNLNKNFTVGFSAHYANSNIDKLSGGNDGSLTGILAAPRSSEYLTSGEFKMIPIYR